MNNTRTRQWFEAVAVAAIWLAACNKAETTEPAGAPRMPGENQMLIEFQGTIDPTAGTFHIDQATGRTASGLMPVNIVQDGMPGSGPMNSVELVTEGTGFDFADCGFASSFCADVTIRSFFTTPLDNVYAQLTRITPAAGHTALNGLPTPPGGPDGTYGLWSYGTLAANGGAATQFWAFGDDGTAYRVSGVVQADVRGALCTICGPGLTAVANGCQATYTIDTAALDNLNGFCDGTGDRRYNNCGGNFGFHWTSVGDAPVTRLDVELADGISCATGANLNVQLNGSSIGGYVSAGSCDCFSGHADHSFLDVGSGAYAVGGFNAVSIGAVSCDGLSRSATFGNAFGRVTTTYACQPGACTGVTCTASDQCHVAGVCNPGTGLCSNPNAPNGTVCDDGDPTTSGSFCVAGNCQALTFTSFDLSGVANIDGVANPGDTTQTSLDNNNAGGNFVLPTQALANTMFPANPNGLPDDGFFFADANHPDVQLRYGTVPDGNNVLQFAGDRTVTINATPAAAYSFIHVFALTGGGSSNFNATLRYSDSTSTTVGPIFVPDWFGAGGTYSLIANLDRVTANLSAYENANNPDIFGLRIATDPTRTLVSVDIQSIGTAATEPRLNIFGVTGQL